MYTEISVKHFGTVEGFAEFFMTFDAVEGPGQVGFGRRSRTGWSNRLQ